MNAPESASPDRRHDSPNDTDETLAKILAELSDRVANGEDVDIETEANAYGSLGEELKELYVEIRLLLIISKLGVI